jgi:hypothetical protein
MVCIKDIWMHVICCFTHFTAYIHIQMAHAGLMAHQLPFPLTIGWLKNEVLERKHKEAKNLHMAEKAGRSSGSSLPLIFCIHVRSGPIYWGGGIYLAKNIIR